MIETLSQNETKALQLVAQGKTRKEIGQEMGYSESRVHHFVFNAFHKLDARNAYHAVYIATKLGRIR